MWQDASNGPHQPDAARPGPGLGTLVGRVAAGVPRRRHLVLGAVGWAVVPGAPWAAQPGQGVSLGLRG